MMAIFGVLSWCLLVVLAGVLLVAGICLLYQGISRKNAMYAYDAYKDSGNEMYLELIPTKGKRIAYTAFGFAFVAAACTFFGIACSLV